MDELSLKYKRREEVFYSKFRANFEIEVRDRNTTQTILLHDYILIGKWINKTATQLHFHMLGDFFQFFTQKLNTFGQYSMVVWMQQIMEKW